VASTLFLATETNNLDTFFISNEALVYPVMPVKRIIHVLTVSRESKHDAKNNYMVC